MTSASYDRYVFNLNETVHYRFPTHTNDLIMDRAEAAASEAFLVILEPGEAPPLHIHRDTEQIFYVISGAGELEIAANGNGDDCRCMPIGTTDLVRIPPSTWHRVYCRGDVSLIYLCIDCFPGGRPSAEPTWESHVHGMCQVNGWNPDDVIGQSSSLRSHPQRRIAETSGPHHAQ